MRASSFAVTSLLIVALSTGCNTSEPCEARLANQYPVPSDAGTPPSLVVYKGWWAVAQFVDPVAPGSESEPVRVVEGSDYGYALLAPGWDSTSGAPPPTLIPVRSSQRLRVERGDTLYFVVSDATTDGNCDAGKPLSQEEADFITQRIFPREFSGLLYDAATCTASSSRGDDNEGGVAGADAD